MALTLKTRFLLLSLSFLALDARERLLDKLLFLLLDVENLYDTESVSGSSVYRRMVTLASTVSSAISWYTCTGLVWPILCAHRLDESIERRTRKRTGCNDR